LLTDCLAADNVNDNHTNLDNSDGKEEEEVSTGKMEEGSSGEDGEEVQE
jgi:hypothetical protein